MSRILCLGLLTWILFLPLSTTAQMDGVCGTIDFESITLRLLRNQQALQQNIVQRRNATTYIPVKLHIVSKSDGTGGARISKVLEQISALNADFKDSEFQFYIDNDFNYFPNNTVYESQSSFVANGDMEGQRSSTAINVFLTNKANHGGGSSDNGTILGYHQTFRDWLVIRNDQVNSSSGTLSHELGHFFSLLHTHSGWESKSWDHSNPSPTQVGLNSPGNKPTEKQDGSNCQNAGDFICDTPPDYNFGFGWVKEGDRCAEYDGGVKDPDGAVVDPMENNFMGYFINCDQYVFTADQNSVMQADYQSSGRSYIRTGYVPNLNPIIENSVLLAPINDEVTNGYNSVSLNWEAVEHADRYLIQVDRLPDFSFALKEKVVFGTTTLFEDLEPNRFYYWRVLPFNEYSTNANFTQSERFKTGSGTTSADYIEGVKEWFISPNPIQAAQNITLSLNSDEPFEADIRIYSLAGQQIHSQYGQSFLRGQNQITLETQDLPKGLYLITLQTPNAVMNKRLVIQ